jgi:type IV pilus assembly protein PilO
MALSAKEVQQAKGFAIFLAVAAVGLYWYMLWNPARTARTDAEPPADEPGLLQLQERVDSLRAEVDTIRSQLAAGELENLAAEIAEDSAQLTMMRHLVPEANDVPALLETIAGRAALRGLAMGSFGRQGAMEPGELFDELRYEIAVVGHYDQIGEFLADIASLPRIMVPYNVVLQPAEQAEARQFGDTTGALLVVSLNLRTFVKRTGEGQ